MQARADRRRQQIMRAAEQLFTNRRFHEITTDEIAAKAGIGKGTIYRYFKNKEDLFFETALNGFEELCAILAVEDSSEDPLEIRLLRACRRIDAFFRNRRRLFGLMQAEENRLILKRGRMRHHWRDRRRRLTDILAGMLDQAVVRGEVRADITAQRQAVLLLGMLKSVAREPKQNHSGTDAVDQTVDLFLHGVETCATANGDIL